MVSGRLATQRCLNHPPTRGKARGLAWWARRARQSPRRDRKSNNSYISKSRRISSVEPNPRPPRRGDHQRRSRRQSHDEPEGGAAGFRAREYFLHCRSARPSGLGEPCWTSPPAASSPPAAGVVALALFARVASTPPDVEDDDDEPLRSQGSSATPVGDDDDVAAFGCRTTRDCCSPLGCSALSVTRGALLAAFFALRKNDICQIACPAPQVQRLDCCRS